MNQTKTYVHIYAIISQIKIKPASKEEKFLSFNDNIINYLNKKNKNTYLCKLTVRYIRKGKEKIKLTNSATRFNPSSYHWFL